jgi:hypothetical protein
MILVSELHKYLEIKAGDVVLELLSLGDLPALKVMEMLKSKEDKLDKALVLMKLASKNPAQFEIEKEYISFNELLLAIDLWLDKSSSETENAKKRLAKKEVKRKSSSVNKKEIEMIASMIESAIEVLIPDEANLEVEDIPEIQMELIQQALKDSGLEVSDATPEEAIMKVAQWFVSHGHAAKLIEARLLTEPNRSGTYYPIVDGVVKRRLGFTLEQAREQSKNE